MNPALWKTDDKAWMSQRKAEWRKVKENLNKMHNEVSRRGHKYHKELFFYGVMDPIFSDSWRVVEANLVGAFGSTELFFKMWYHPEPTEEALAELFYQEGSAHSHRALLEMLFRAFSHADFTSDYGMLGGREELFVRVLLPGLDWQEERPLATAGETYRASIHPGLVTSYCISHTAALLYGHTINPYIPGQYLWSHFLYALEHYPELAIEEDEKKFRDKQLRAFIRLILDFNVRESAPTDRPIAVTMRNWLYERFEQENMPEKLMAYWREEKEKFEAEQAG